MQVLAQAAIEILDLGAASHHNAGAFPMWYADSMALVILHADRETWSIGRDAVAMEASRGLEPG